MKYLKMLGLAAVAAAALMALASPASATTLTNGKSEAYPSGTVIHAVSKGHATLDSVIGKISCNSTVEGTTSNAGGTGVAVTGHITKLLFEPCTTAVVKVLTTGTLTIVGDPEEEGKTIGTLSSTGAEVTVETFGVHCIYKTNNTPLGKVTGGTNAVLDINAEIPRTGGKSGAFCGGPAPWTGSYEVTSPTPLNIDV